MFNVLKLFRYFKQYKKDAILTVIFVLFECAIDLLIPFLMANIIDRGISNVDANQRLPMVLKYGALITLISFCALFFGILSSIYSAKASCGLSYNIREGMYRNVQTFSFRKIDKFSIPSIITRLTTDISFIQFAVQISIRAAIRAPIMITFAMLFAGIINYKYALMYLCGILILLITLPIAFKFIKKTFDKLFASIDEINLVNQETIRGIRLVKAYSREKYEIDKLDKASRKLRSYAVKVEFMMAFVMPMMSLLIFVIMILVQYFAGYDVVRENIKIGQLTSLVAYAMQIFSSIIMLSFGLVMLVFAKSPIDRVAEITSEQTDLKSKKNAIEYIDKYDIVFDNVAFKYQDDAEDMVVKNINLNIKEGESIGILGATGSAKSTLVQLIPRIYDVSSGSIKIGGIDLRDYSLDILRENIAIVLQNNILFKGSIRDNLDFNSKINNDDKIWHALEVSGAKDFVLQKEGGLDYMLELGGSNLSGGQKQRLCIARALLKNPKIIIFDDSTSAVDTNTDRLIRENLKNVGKAMTKIIIAQRVTSVSDLDRIIILDKGELVASGTHDELLVSSTVYKELYNSQRLA